MLTIDWASWIDIYNWCGLVYAWDEKNTHTAPYVRPTREILSIQGEVELLYQTPIGRFKAMTSL